MSVSEYKVGKFYKLRDDCVDVFIFTSDIRRLMHIEGKSKRAFIFAPTDVSNGIAYVDGVAIANNHERTMFDELGVWVTRSGTNANTSTSTYQGV